MMILIKGALLILHKYHFTTTDFSMILGLSEVLGSASNWPVLVSLTAVPSVLQTILLLFLPESPRYFEIPMQLIS